MPANVVEKLGPEHIEAILKGECICISPSQAHLNAIETRLFSGGHDTIWGDVLLTPSTFIKQLSDPKKPSSTPLIERAIVLDILNRTPLKYFEAVKRETAIGNEFVRAIMLLRRNLIHSEQLERDLSERGSLKEFDLLTVYKKYEENIRAHGLWDEGDRLRDVIGKIGACHPCESGRFLSCQMQHFGSRKPVAAGFSLRELRTLKGAATTAQVTHPKGCGYHFGNSLESGNDKHLIFDGFELLPPGLLELIRKISEHSPSVSITIVQPKIAPNPIYEKYLGLIEAALSSGQIHPSTPRPLDRLGTQQARNAASSLQTTGGQAGQTGQETPRNDIPYSSLTHDDAPAPATHDGIQWELPCTPELHICRSGGNEWRFVSEAMANLIEGGMRAEAIGLLVSPHAEGLKDLILNLRYKNLIPKEAVSCYEGRFNSIRREIDHASTLNELASIIETKFASRLKSSFRDEGHLPHIAANLKQLQGIFDEIFQLKELAGLGLNIDDIKDDLLTDLTPSPKTLIRTELCAFNWLWWGEGIYPELDTIFIPSAYQGGIPPQEPASIFFQETAFLPGNAPACFANLFPQADMIRAKEGLRFRRYLESACNRSVLSFSRISSSGKETNPASLTAMFDFTETDEGLKPYPIDLNDEIKKEMLRRSENELAGRKRATGERASVINDKKVKAEIKKRFTEAAFSATTLERYGRCPYQYFLQKVLGLEPIETPTPEINPKDRGIIIHRIMELFYTHEVENVLKFIRKELPWKFFETKMDEYIEMAFAQYKDLLSNTHSALVEHFKKRTQTTCMNALSLEIELINDMKHPLLPKYSEWGFGKDGVPHLTLKGAPLEAEARLTGVIDRIDIDPDNNTFSITDYKTGNTYAVMGKIAKGEHLQLPLYIEAVKRLLLTDKKPVGAFLFSLKTMAKKHGMALKSAKSYYFSTLNSRLFVDEEKWDELVATVLGNAKKYISQIRDSVFIEDASNCGHLCDFKEICRYGKK